MLCILSPPALLRRCHPLFCLTPVCRLLECLVCSCSCSSPSPSVSPFPCQPSPLGAARVWLPPRKRQTRQDKSRHPVRQTAVPRCTTNRCTVLECWCLTISPLTLLCFCLCLCSSSSPCLSVHPISTRPPVSLPVLRLSSVSTHTISLSHSHSHTHSHSHRLRDVQQHGTQNWEPSLPHLFFFWPFFASFPPDDATISRVTSCTSLTDTTLYLFRFASTSMNRDPAQPPHLKTELNHSPPLPSHPIHSHPIQSNTIPSHPIPPHRSWASPGIALRSSALPCFSPPPLESPLRATISARDATFPWPCLSRRDLTCLACCC